MTLRFATALARLNAAAVERLATAVATIGGTDYNVVFDNGYAQAGVGMLGMGTTQPSIGMLTSNVPAEPDGTALLVDGTAYTIARHEPDGLGWSMLYLEQSA